MYKKIFSKNLFLATGNLGKIKEFRNLLAEIPLNIIAMPKDLEIEETGKSFVENARMKAFAVSQSTGDWSLADDSGLEVESLKGAPGIYSARYAATDEERIARLLKELEPFDDRSARFVSSLCLTSKDNILIEVQGVCEGKITYKPRGENGFGYDPIFEVVDKGVTFAEMSVEEKKIFGHRGKAFNLLNTYLKTLLNKNS